MPTTFSRSMRSLTADGFRRSILGLLLVAVLLGGGLAWFFLARVALYETTDTARLEVAQAIHPVEAVSSGRVVAIQMLLGHEVQVGDVLVELDAEFERIQLAERRTGLVTLSQQFDALRNEITVVEQAWREEQQAALLMLDEVRIRHQNAKAVANFAEEEVKRLTRLHEGGHLAEVNLRQARSNAQQWRAASSVLRFAVSKLEKEHQSAPLALDGARARYREAESVANFAEEELERLTRLYEGGALPEIELRRAKSEAKKQKAAADALRFAVNKLEKETQAMPLALDEERAKYREAESVANFAEEELERLIRLHAEEHPDEVILRQAKVEVQQRRMEADALRLSISKLELEQRASEKSYQARLARLKRETILLKGKIDTTKATIKQLEYELERRRIRAPVAGQLGEIAELKLGAFVREGDKLGTIVPPGELKAIAHFPPPAALGRIRPGQFAQLRLEGFPWTQYGSISATVASVANEPRQGRVRVELVVHSHPDSSIPIQHGLPGTLEIKVDSVSPATLVLRASGRFLSRPGTARSSLGK